jgi:hypothetical protein
MKYTIQRFNLFRTVDETGYSGTGIVAQGVVFGNGKVVLCWLNGNSGVSSIAIYESYDDALKIHGHGGTTGIEFLDTE